MSIVKLPDIVYPLAHVNKTNEIIDVLNDNLEFYYAGTNPALTPVEGVCTWTITHNLGTEDVNCAIYEGDDEVIANVEITSANVVTVTINSASNIAKDAYSIMITAGGSTGGSAGPTIEVDQIYDANSENPQSGVAIAGAGFISGIDSTDVTDALGYTPANNNDLVNYEPAQKPMGTLGTSGSIALTDNNAYKITPTGTVTFTLPSVTDKTKLHQILVQIKLTSTYTINVGTTYYFNKTKPNFSSTGTYNLIYEYDNIDSHWVCGSVSKGTE